MNQIVTSTPDKYWTNQYSVHRHDPRFCTPGKYAVIVQNLELLWMTTPHATHPECVVDDFGGLVAVPH